MGILQDSVRALTDCLLVAQVLPHPIRRPPPLGPLTGRIAAHTLTGEAVGAAECAPSTTTWRRGEFR